MAEPQMDPGKVRIGLILISVVVLTAIVLFLAVSDPLGKAIMFAVALVGIVRVAFLFRALRRERR